MEQQNELTTKEKIVLVLRESIRVGKECNFVYHVMFEKHKEVWNINKLNLTIDEKIKLFNNLDENSELFKNIHGTAKLALTKLKDDEGYNFYSADLILKMNMLEDIFKNKLRSTGTRIIDQVEKPKPIIQENKEEEIEYASDEDIFDGRQYIENVELPSGKFLRENVTGKNLKTKIVRKKDIITSLQQSQL